MPTNSPPPRPAPAALNIGTQQGDGNAALHAALWGRHTAYHSANYLLFDLLDSGADPLAPFPAGCALGTAPRDPPRVAEAVAAREAAGGGTFCQLEAALLWTPALGDGDGEWPDGMFAREPFLLKPGARALAGVGAAGALLAFGAPCRLHAWRHVNHAPSFAVDAMGLKSRRLLAPCVGPAASLQVPH